MTKTQNYNLNQWESTDPIRREDFNADNAAIDAALGELNIAVAAGLKMQTGSYKGKDKYGSANPNTLILNFEPKFLLIWSSGSAHLAKGILGGYLMVQYDYSSFACTATWSGNTVSWYHGNGAQQQMNDSDNTYYYLALG